MAASESQTRRSPAATGLRQSQSHGVGSHGNGSPADGLLQRLDGVRRAGKGWVARCPAHDDRTASLSIGEGADGRVLLHCHAGCPAVAVVAAVGLELADLFPRRLDTGHLAPDQRRILSLELRIARQWAALGAVLPELAVIEVGGRLAAAGQLDRSDAAKVTAAVDRVHEIRVAVQGGAR